MWLGTVPGTLASSCCWHLVCQCFVTITLPSVQCCILVFNFVSWWLETIEAPLLAFCCWKLVDVYPRPLRSCWKYSRFEVDRICVCIYSEYEIGSFHGMAYICYCASPILRITYISSTLLTHCAPSTCHSRTIVTTSSLTISVSLSVSWQSVGVGRYSIHIAAARAWNWCDMNKLSALNRIVFRHAMYSSRCTLSVRVPCSALIWTGIGIRNSYTRWRWTMICIHEMHTIW